MAFKVTYNDGGARGRLVGYRGVCTNGVIAENTGEDGAVWCRQAENPCSRFACSGFAGPRPRVEEGEGPVPCYEATLLSRKPFRFGAGYFHHGPLAGEPMSIKRVDTGNIAFLTTLRPGQPQEERFVFGLFRVGRIYEQSGWGFVVESDGTMDIRLPDDVASAVRYWNYQLPNKDGSRSWKSKLHRYLDEQVTAALLGDILHRLGNHHERDTIVRALGGAAVPVAQPRAAPMTLPLSGGSAGEGTGEGEAHRALKFRVANDPTLIGLPRESTPTVEYVFANTGDRVDLQFDLPDGTAAVVEIETICPLPGAHQCVKYRALHQVERAEELGGLGVRAILVAHEFDENTLSLARRYGIRLVELPPVTK